MAEEGLLRPKLKINFIDGSVDNEPLPGSEGAIEEVKGKMSHVPLPNQLPSSPRSATFADQFKKSGAIDSLIQQNEDLMARLTVAIRRHSLLEEKVEKFETTLQQLREHNDILADQLLVYREKDRLQGDHRRASEKQIQELQEQVSLLEIQYAEFYASSREKQQQLTSNLDKASRILARYRTYRTRIQRLGRHKRSQIRQQISLLEKDNFQLSEKLQAESLMLQDVRKKLGEAVDHIQRQGTIAESNQRQLVNNYEDQLTHFQEQLKEGNNRIAQLESQLSDQEELFQNKVSLENELVAKTRSFSESQNHFESELSRIQTECSEFRREAKQNHLEVGRLNAELESHKLQNSQLSEKNKTLEDQVESLQCLWRDTHLKLEQQTEKYHSLQKLNQQLSTSLNEQRLEMALLKEQRDTSRFQTECKIKELEGQVKVLGSTHSAQDQDQSQPTEELDVQHRQILIQRIDDLISEIQSGFSITVKKDEENTD